MTPVHLNQLWAETVVRALVAAGVRHVVMAPGSRSAPLALATADAAADGRLQAHLHQDERVAAFVGLGIARYTGKPVALVCTSGTAGTHFHAAAAEARASGIPLVLITADRPPDLRHAHAHQTIDQRGLYGPSVLLWRDLGLPRAETSALRHLQATVAQAVAATLGVPRGPIHLNVPLGDWLHPGPDPAHHPDLLARLAADLPPVPRYGPTRLMPEAEALEAATALVREARRPLVVLGSLGAPWDGEAGPLEEAGFIVLRDPAAHAAGTGVRGGHLEVMVRAAAQLGLEPDLVIRAGAGPVSGTTLRWLAGLTVPVIQLQPDLERWDADGRATLVLPGTAGNLLAQLAVAREAKSESPSPWQAAWERLRTTAVNHAATAVLPPEPDAVRLALAHWPEHGQVVVGNSMPIRYVDFVGTNRVRILANRGAAGIDGQVATALGVRLAADAPTLLVTGDVAFLHDLGAWAAATAAGAPMAVLLLDNDGGGIFHTLPIGDHPAALTPWCTSPHGLDPSAALEAFGVVVHHPRDDAGLRHALDEALGDDRPHVLRIACERDSGMTAWQHVLSQGAARAAEAVGSWNRYREELAR